MALLIRADRKIEAGKERQGWGKTYDALHPKLSSIPQVKSGAVTIEQAEVWLETASKTLKSAHVVRQISELGQFNVDDIRALWAHDHNEYYPSYEAVEVYKQKTMQVFRSPESDDVAKFHMTNMMYEAFRKQMNLQTMAPSKAKVEAPGIGWLGQKGMFILEPVTGGGAAAIYDFKVNYNNRLTTSDEVRHHYYQLAAGNRGFEINDSFQVNFIIPEHLLKTLNELSGLDPSSNELAKNLFDNALSNGQIRFEMDKVVLSPTTYSKITESGQRHMSNIQNAVTPEFRTLKKDKAKLTTEQQHEVIDAGKEYTAARAVLDVAKQQFEVARAKLPMLMKRFEISGDYENPYPLAKVGDNRPFDLTRATQALVQMGVPEHLFSDPQYNEANMVSALKAAGMNVNEFVDGLSANKAKVQEMLDLNGIDPEQFRTSGVHTHRAGDTRGELAEITEEIREFADAEVSKTIAAVSSAPATEKPVQMARSTHNPQREMKVGM